MRSLKHVILFLVLLGVIALVVFGKTIFDRTYQRVHTFTEVTSKLAMENQRLKFELERLKSEQIPSDESYILAHVYSRYPFNDREMLTIDLGSENDIAVGMPVLTTEEFLVGKVVSVHGRQAQVQTVFDAAWRSSVAIGELENKAVFKGGQYPRLELIARAGNSTVGDEVFNIAPEFPLYQLIGTVAEIMDHPGEPWQKGRVAVRYDIGNINEVFVIIDFP